MNGKIKLTKKEFILQETNGGKAFYELQFPKLKPNGDDAFKNVTFRLGHTYTYKSADLDYIPKNKFTALIETSVLPKTYMSLRLKNISKRTFFDQWGSGANVTMDSYNLVDYYGSYEIIKNRLTVFGHVNNIFDEDYVETIGFTTKGRNFKIGLNFTY